MKLQLTITKDRPDMNISANAISREYELSFSKANIVLHLNNDFNYATKEWVQSQNFLNKDATAKDSSKLGGYEAKHYMRGRYVGNSNPNLNAQLETGIYRYNNVAGWNAPEGSTDYGNLMVIRGGDQDTLTQIYFNHDDDRVFLRSGSTSNAFATYIANQSWKEIAFKSAIPTLVSQLQNDAGYIKNLTSSMVSSALGYIPANSSQVTKTKLKQTLGISDWALEPIPPICSWNDILDKPDNIGSGSGAIDTETAEKLKQLSDKFDSMFEIDTANNAIRAKKSLYSEGSISALGLGIGGSNSGSGSGGTDSGSGSTGGGVSYSRLDSWDEYDASKSHYVLSAYLGNDLYTRVKGIENAGFITDRVTKFTVDAIDVRSSLSLRAKSDTPNDTPDIGFFAYDGTELGRIFKPENVSRFYARFGSGNTFETIAFLSDIGNLGDRITALEEHVDRMFEIDDNGYIKAKMSFYSIGAVSAKGIGFGGGNTEGGSGGNNGPSYSRLDSWDEYHPNNATYVLSAYLGNDLNTRLKSVENGGYINQSILTEKLLGYATITITDELADRITANEDQIEILGEKTKDLHVFTALVETNRTNIAKNTDSITALAKTIEEDEEILGDLSIAVQNLENRVSTNEKGISNNKDNIAALTTTVSELEAKLDRMFEIDDNGYIKAKMSFYSIGAVSAKGIGFGGGNTEGGSGGNNGPSYSRLDSWDEYHPNNATYVLSAYLGNDLNTRLKSVENGGYITSSALNGYATQDWVNGALMDYALASDIPSLTGYATQNWVTRELGSYAKSIAVPINNNQLINGAGYISNVTASMVKNALGYTPLSTTGTAANSNQLGGRTADQYMVSRFSPSHKDINQTLDVGIYRFDTLNNPPKLADGTVVGTNYGNLMVIRGGGQDTLTQIYFNWDNQAAYIRSGNTSGVVARSWNEIAYRSHIPTHLSQLTDDMVAGHYLPLTGGSLYGSLSVPSITIGGITISVGTDGALQINGNMYATGSITAKKIA